MPPPLKVLPWGAGSQAGANVEGPLCVGVLQNGLLMPWEVVWFGQSGEGSTCQSFLTVDMFLCDFGSLKF
jgi:hypothetical protein